MWWNTCSKGKDGGQEETNKLLTETEEDKNENVIAQKLFQEYVVISIIFPDDNEDEH